MHLIGRTRIAIVLLLSLSIFRLARGAEPPPAAASQPNPTDTHTAAEILERTAATYRACRSIRLRGFTQSTRTHADHRAFTQESQFTIAYVRPKQFRFQYDYSFFGEQGSDSRFSRHKVVWWNGDDIQSWRTGDDEPEKETSIRMALCSAGMVGGGMATFWSHTLLLPIETEDSFVSRLTNPARLGNASVDDRLCYVVRAMFVDRPVTFWIDEKSFAVRRIDETAHIKDWTNETTTRLESSFDVDIPPDALALNLPRPTAAKPWGERVTEATGANPNQDTLTADEIMNMMQRGYLTCRSYQDTGEVRDTFIEDGKVRFVNVTTFQSAFVRPAQLRFEFNEGPTKSPQRYIVWGDGSDVRVYWSIKAGIEKPDSLGLALAGATGVSSGSAHTIPALLIPNEVGGRTLMDTTKRERLPDAKIEDDWCYRIQGLFADNPIVLWIETDRFLVRRIDESSQLPSGKNESTTQYSPDVGIDVLPEDLAFKAPGVTQDKEPADDEEPDKSLKE